MASSLMQQMQAGGRMTQELKNNHKPYEQTK